MPALIWREPGCRGGSGGPRCGVTSPGPELEGESCALSASWRCRGRSAYVRGPGEVGCLLGSLQQYCLARPSSRVLRDLRSEVAGVDRLSPSMHSSHRGVPLGPVEAEALCSLLCTEHAGPRSQCGCRSRAPWPGRGCSQSPQGHLVPSPLHTTFQGLGEPQLRGAGGAFAGQAERRLQKRGVCGGQACSNSGPVVVWRSVLTAGCPW